LLERYYIANNLLNLVCTIAPVLLVSCIELRNVGFILLGIPDY
jgi:hypothetical protein